MNLWQKIRRGITALALVLVVVTLTACGGGKPSATAQLPASPSYSQSYQALERGNSATGQNFGNWVVQTAKGLVADAYVRDNNKLGVVISSKVRPTEVKPLAKSLLQGFHRNFPSQDVSVLVYAPDKKLILTAKYDTQSGQIQYQAA